MNLLDPQPVSLLSTFGPLFTCSITGRQVAAESHRGHCSQSLRSNTVQMSCLSFVTLFTESTFPEGRKSEQWHRQRQRQQQQQDCRAKVMGCRTSYANPCIIWGITSRVRILDSFTQRLCFSRYLAEAERAAERQRSFQSTPSWLHACVSRPHWENTS